MMRPGVRFEEETNVFTPQVLVFLAENKRFATEEKVCFNRDKLTF